MQATHPHLFGDLGDQIPAALLSLGIRGPIDDRPERLQRKAAAISLPEFDYISPAEADRGVNGIHDGLTRRGRSNER